MIKVDKIMKTGYNYVVRKVRNILLENGGFYMELAKVTSKGQVTIPIEIRKKLGIKNGDKILFVDAKTISEYGVRTIQLHTGGMCHLDADMTRQGLHEMGMEDLDLAVLENVGNLVCPAEFDTGSTKNVAILSVPEGDDKPLKYPLMFQVCDVVLINKMDVLPYFDFDVEKCKENILYRNPNAKIFEVCAKTGEGIDDWCKWLENEVKAWKE